MSHTETIKGVTINDINAVMAAVEELNKSGVRCQLLQNERPRLYYANQHGVCPYVLNLLDSPYDVGLALKKDGKGYELVTDLWGGHVARLLKGKGATPVARFTSLYAKHRTLAVARSKGHTVDSITERADGGWDLVIGTANSLSVSA